MEQLFFTVSEIFISGQIGATEREARQSMQGGAGKSESRSRATNYIGSKMPHDDDLDRYCHQNVRQNEYKIQAQGQVGNQGKDPN